MSNKLMDKIIQEVQNEMVGKDIINLECDICHKVFGSLIDFIEFDGNENSRIFCLKCFNKRRESK